MHGDRILIVGARPATSRLAQIVLEAVGCDVRVVADAAEAAALGQAFRPRLILLDLAATGAAGLELIRQLEGNPASAEIVVVALTRRGMEAEEARVREAGCDGCIAEPITPRALAAAVEHYLCAAGSGDRSRDDFSPLAIDDSRRGDLSQLQRRTLHRATTAALDAIAEAFAAPLDAVVIVSTVLAQCLDAAGLTVGACYVERDDGGLELRADRGLPDSPLGAAATNPAALARVRRAIDGAVPVAFTASDDDEAAGVLAGLGQASALIVPLSALGEPRAALLFAADTALLGDESWIAFAGALAAQLDQAILLGRMIARLAASEAHYRSLFDDALEAIMQTTPAGRFLTANPAAARMLGYRSPDELVSTVGNIGRELYLEPAEREALLGLLQKEGEVRGFEARLRRKDGRIASIRFNARAVLDANGAIAHFDCVAQDLSERREAEAALRASEERLQHIVDTSPAVIYVLRLDDPTFAATWVSANVERLTGDSAAEALAPGWWSAHLADEDRAAVIARFVEGIPLGHLAHEYRFRHRDGTWLWVHDELRVIRDASGAPLEAVGSWVDVTERRRVEDALRESESRYRALFEATPSAMWVYDPIDLRIVAANEAAVAQYGYSRAELLGMTLRDVRSPEEVPRLDAVAATPSFFDRHVGVWRHRRKDGSELLVDIHVANVLLRGQALRIAILHDVTERHRLEEQLQQAQKMEAVGRLAGGVAHDFNNVLTIIIYCAEMLRDRDPQDSVKRRRALEEILGASDRAAGLTRQLLAFSRKQVVAPRIVDLNEVIDSTGSLLHRLLGEHIDLRYELDEDLWPVRVDVGQFEQVLMNLALNARDAMPGGGQLVIETHNLQLDQATAERCGELAAGPCVAIAVSDTGSGIDPASMAHLFEPFFTTKEQGKGTGLGLATVYGIVRQSGGAIRVESEPGSGARFEVLLPRADGEVEASRAAVSNHVREGSETVLLVEDEDSVRELAAECLREAGYDVLEAARPSAALRLATEHRGPIAALLTDVVMPEMHGPELAAQLRRLRPGIRVLFMSGYAHDTALPALREAEATLIQKPFRAADLTRKLREVLDAAP